MKLSTPFFVLLLCFTAESFNHYMMYPSPLSANNPKKCLEPGLLCETCSHLVACIENANGTYFQEPLEACDPPLRCVGGGCVQNTTDPFCSGLADLPFVCKKVGIFPDPFYCNKFVLCVNNGNTLTPYLNECEEGFQFNIATSLCDIVLVQRQCEEGKYAVPICETVGQTGALPQKPEIFYVCEEYSNKIYPVLNVCPGGQVYDNNYRCIEAHSISTMVDTTTLSPH